MPRLASGSLRERPRARRAIAEAEAALRSARAFVFDAVGDVWDVVCAGGRADPRQRALVRLACSHACQEAIRAVELPIRFDAAGPVAADILDADREVGFYTFTGVLGPEELADIEHDVADVLDRAPVAKGAGVDRHGHPALGSDCQARTVSWDRSGGEPEGLQPARPRLLTAGPRPRRYNGAMTMTVDTLLAREEIAGVLHRYARGIDRLDFDLVRSCYHPDAYDDHGTMKGSVDEFVAAAQAFLPRFAATMHFLGNMFIEVDGDVARAETYAVAYHRLEPEGAAGKDDIWGIRYVDRFERRAGEWRIAHRVVAQEWRRVEPVPAGRGRGVEPGVWGRRDRGDVLYGVLEATAPTPA